MKTGIIFDLDGTLLDTLEDLYLAVNHTMEHFGCPVRTRQEVRRFVGNGARNLVSRALPGKETDPPLETVLAFYQDYYDQLCIRGNTCPFPGISEMLEKLTKEYPVAVVSNKPDISVKPLCENFFPGVYALGATEDCPRKPQPDMVKKAMAALNVDKCIYVGDSEVDVETAKNTGCTSLIVLWGFRDREELEAAGAVNFCEKVEDMIPMLSKLLQQN